MSSLQTETWHILHIEDDEDDHLIVRSMLNEAQGRAVDLDWAATFEEGRRKLCSYHYQAVLVDYDLGIGTGITLIREAVNRGYAAPMILLTGRGSYEVDVEAMHAGATLYLSKNEINALLLERSIRYAIERKQVEQDLMERDRKLSVALNAAELGTWTYHFDDHMFEMDERAQKMYCANQPRESHDVIVQNFLHPKDAQPMWAALDQAADPTGDGRYQIEYRLLQPDGSVRWLNAWGIVEFEGQGIERRAVRLMGASRDITREKQTREALHESEGRFRDLANNISQLAWMADESGWIFWYNQRWFDYTGTTLEEMEGWGWQKVHHPGHVARVVEKIKRCFETGEYWEDTFPLRGKDGQYCWFLSRAVPIRDEQGRVVRWFGTNTDVTEQQQLQEENLEQKDLLERMLQAIPVGIAFLKGPQHVYELVNAEYQKYARGKGELVGHPVAEKWPEIAEAIIPQMNRVYQTGEPFSITDAPLRIVHDGVPEDEFFSYTFTPIYKADGSIEGVMILAVDTTAAVQDRKAVEAQSARLETVLQSLPVGVWIADQNGRLIGKNEQADRIWAGDAPLSADISAYQEYTAWYCDSGKMLSPEDYPVAKALLTGQPVNPVELQIRRFDSTEGTILVSAAPIQDGEGQLTGAVGINMDITERKQVEEALRLQREALQESERSVKELAERFRAVLENSLDVAYRRNLQTNQYDYMSPVSEQVLGFTVEEMITMTFEEAVERIHPQDRLAVEMGLQRAAKHGKGKLEYRFKCKDGIYRWVADHVTVTKGEEGEPLYRTGILRDVTEQVLADQALRASEERFQLASRAVTGVLYDLSIDRDELYQSEGLERVVGYRPGEEPGGSKDWWPRNIHSEDAPRVQAELQAAINGQSDSISYEYRIRHKEGHWVHILDQGYIVRDERGQAQRVVGICTDISDRVRAEQTLRESENKYRALAETLDVERATLAASIDHLPIGVGIGDTRGNILSLNSAGLRLHGFASEAEMLESLEQYAREFELCSLAGQALPLAEWPISRALRGDFVQDYEMLIRSKQKGFERFVSYSVAPVQNSNGETILIVYVIRDLTERRLAELALEDYAEKLKRSNEELENFAFVASHDLQEPLRKIQMFGNILQERLDGQLSDESGEYLKRMQSAAERMRDMVQGLLDLSRVNTRGNPFEAVNLTDAAEEVVSDLEVRIQATGGRVVVEPLPTIEGDVVQLRQLLQNLIGNGLKFHQEGTVPEVRVLGEVTQVDQNRMARIVVEDNGIGFDEKNAERLFQPFVRLHGRSEFEGSGIGLAICRKIVERHGGSITANSQPGVGSQFIITLPVNGVRL